MGGGGRPRVGAGGADGVGPQRVVRVGKWLTVDRGGFATRPDHGMLTMKGATGGAAAVRATLRVVADLRLPLKLTGLACIAENMPNGNAQRPSDVKD